MYKIINKRLWVFMLSVQIIGFLSYLLIYANKAYLPSPFFYDKNDTFMDLINPLWWAIHGSAYTEWHSVYPPLNFLILKLLNLITLGEHIDYGTAFQLRNHCNELILVYLAISLTIPFLIIRSQSWIISMTGVERILFCLLFVLSFPFLHTLERGNLVIFCLPLFAFFIEGRGVLQALALAFLVNIKPYFAILFFVYLYKDEMAELILASAMSIILFIASSIVFDTASYRIFENLAGFGNSNIFTIREILTLPNSISSFAYILASEQFSSHHGYFVNMMADLISSMINFVKFITTLSALLILYLKRRNLTKEEIIIALMLCIMNLGVSVGGYILIIYFALFPFLINKKFSAIYAVSIFLIFMPLDFVSIFNENHIMKTFSFLGQSTVDVEWSLGVGALLRPIINFFVLVTFCFEASKVTRISHK